MKLKLLHNRELKLKENLKFFLFFGILIICGCNSPCEPEPDTEPEEIIYLNIIRGDISTIVSADENGEDMKLLQDDAILYSAPSINGAIAFVRGNDIFRKKSNALPEKATTGLLNQAEAVISPDAKYISFHAEENGLYILKEDLVSIYNLSSSTTPGNIASFSKDSKYIAYFSGTEGNIKLEVKTSDDDFQQTVVEEDLGSPDKLGQITWSSNGKLSFYLQKGNEYQLYVSSPNNGTEATIKLTAFRISSSHITATGDSIAFRNDDDGKIYIRNISGDAFYREIKPISGSFTDKGDLKISDDGSYLAATRKTGSFENLVVINLKTDRQNIVTGNAANWFFGRK